MAAFYPQLGVSTRQRLRADGLSTAEIDAQVDGRRWRRLNDGVICLHNGPLTVGQARAAVVLGAQEPHALCSLTGMELWGIPGFETPQVHVLVHRGGRVADVPGVEVVVHESRRFTGDDVVRRAGMPVTSLERSVIDAAVWAPDVRTASRIMVAPVQRRLTTAARLSDVLLGAGKVRYGKVLRRLLDDLGGGAQALSEVEFLRWCRRHGFPEPALDVRSDVTGRRRYLDARFVRADGTIVDVEIDGGVHLTLTTRWLDTVKDNDAVLAGRLSLRFPSVALYTDDERAVVQLRRALGCVSR